MITASVCAPPLAAGGVGLVSAAWSARGVRGRDDAAERGDGPDDALARLSRLVASNDRHLAELRALDARLATVNAHLATRTPGAIFGLAFRDRVRSQRSCVLAVLRANRIAAREFLGR